MGRATTKKDLIDSATKNYEKLTKLLDGISYEGLNHDFTFNTEDRKEAHWKRDKNIKDVLIHLYEWQEMQINWVKSNISGEYKPFLPKPYNWKTYGNMNVEFWKKHQNISYIDAFELFRNSHKVIMTMIETFSNDELFSKGYYKWTGGSTLGTYFVANTASHYDWAAKKIKLHVSTLK